MEINAPKFLLSAKTTTFKMVFVLLARIPTETSKMENVLTPTAFLQKDNNAINAKITLSLQQANKFASLMM